MAKRWEELAEFRHQQLLLEEAQMLQLQEIDGGIIRDHQGSSGIIGGLVLFLFWLRGTTRYIQIPPVCICKQ